MPQETSQDGSSTEVAEESGQIGSSDAYQTVTIVPSDTNSGEVSYVLIVQQPDDKNEKGGEDQDLTVYDFDDAEEGSMAVVRI